LSLLNACAMSWESKIMSPSICIKNLT